MTLDEIEAKLRRHDPATLPSAASRRAAVTLALHQAAAGVQFLLIHRAERYGDPWSGQMALPGGRQQTEDPDLQHTALRETREEVGLDLFQLGRPVGPLDEIQAVSRNTAVDLIITPFVHAIEDDPPPLAIDPGEVQGALWVPIRDLMSPEARTTFEFELGGRHFRYPAFEHRGYTIWGLTYRILSQFLNVIEGTPD